jgi:hypothetical protein
VQTQWGLYTPGTPVRVLGWQDGGDAVIDLGLPRHPMLQGLPAEAVRTLRGASARSARLSEAGG